MTQSVRLTNYLDFDRFLLRGNLLTTIIGAAIAFVASYLPFTFIDIPYSPFGFSFTFALIIAVVVYTRNVASTLIVSVVSVLGLVSINGDELYFFLGYIQFTIILSLILGIFADRLRLVVSWTRMYLIFGAIFSIIFVVMSLLTNPFAQNYWDAGIKLGIGGDQYMGTEYPLIEIASIFGILIILLIATISLRGQISLDNKSAKKYRIWGIFLIIVGFSLSLVSLILFSETVDYNQIGIITNFPSHIKVIDNLFTHQEVSKYAVFVAPVNGYIVAAFTTMLTAAGLAYFTVGKNHGNIDGMKGAASVIAFTPAIGTLLFFGIASWYLQNLIAPNAFYIAVELFPVYFNILWAQFIISSIAAYVFYAIFGLIFKK